MPERASLRDLIEFAGWSTIRAICLLWAFGLIYLLLELGFAYLLQQFLIALGLVSIQPVNGSRLGLDLSLNKIILLIFIVASARAAVSFAQNVGGGGAMERFSHRMRRMIIEDCLNQTSVSTAETLTFFNERIYTATMTIQAAQSLALQGTLIIGLLFSLFWMSPVPTLLLLLVVSMILLPVRVLNKQLKRSATLHADTFSRVMLHLNNVFRNFLLIRLFNLQKSEKSKILGHLKTYSDHITRYYWIEGVAGALVPLVVVLTVVCVALLQNTTVAIERSFAVPYLYLSFRLALNLSPLVNNMSRLAFGSGQFRYTFRWWLERKNNLTLRTLDDDATSGHDGLPVRDAIGWKLNAVTFGYPDQPLLFRDFRLLIAPGALVSVRGYSGVGKSTLVRLLVGEAVPHGGSIEVQLDGDSYAVSDVAARLRDHIGYSSTEPYLFEGTIYENITYGLKAPPDEDFLREEAARAECQFIFEFPKRFEHWIDELGQGLSTGQKQRLSLLRALLRKPRALILDEALSNVDTRTENRILSNLIGIKRGCTILLISHRDHTSIPSDAVVNLEDLL